MLNEIAALVGRWNSLAGLSVLAVVVLLKLTVIVALVETVRPGLSALDTASRSLVSPADDMARTGTASDSFLSALALSLVPFFAFYAAWGFLGDTVRDYSRSAPVFFYPAKAVVCWMSLAVYG